MFCIHVGLRTVCRDMSRRVHRLGGHAASHATAVGALPHLGERTAGGARRLVTTCAFSYDAGQRGEGREHVGVFGRWGLGSVASRRCLDWGNGRCCLGPRRFGGTWDARFSSTDRERRVAIGGTRFHMRRPRRGASRAEGGDPFAGRESRRGSTGSSSTRSDNRGQRSGTSDGTRWPGS